MQQFVLCQKTVCCVIILCCKNPHQIDSHRLVTDYLLGYSEMQARDEVETVKAEEPESRMRQVLDEVHASAEET